MLLPLSRTLTPISTKATTTTTPATTMLSLLVPKLLDGFSDLAGPLGGFWEYHAAGEARGPVARFA